MSNFRRNLMFPNNKEEYRVGFYAVVNEHSKILYDFDTSLYSYGIGFTLSIDDWFDGLESESATPVYPCTLEVIIKNKQKDTIVNYKKTLSEIDKRYYKDGTQNRINLDTSSVSEFYAWELPYGNYFVEIVISSQKILFKDKNNLNQTTQRYSSSVNLSNFTFTFRGSGDSKNPPKKAVNGYCFKHLISNNRSNKSKFNFNLTKPPLSAPTNLKLVTEDGTLSWDAVENAESYNIVFTTGIYSTTRYAELNTKNTTENVKDYLIKWDGALLYGIGVEAVPPKNSIYGVGTMAKTTYTVPQEE